MSTKQAKDGITRAERRVLGRAGVDVMLTYGSFKLPGVQERGPSNMFPNRRIYFSRRTNASGFNVSFAKSSIQAKEDEDQQFLPRDEDEDDNTDSYNKVRKIIFGQAIKYNVTKLEQNSRKSCQRRPCSKARRRRFISWGYHACDRFKFYYDCCENGCYDFKQIFGRFVSVRLHIFHDFCYRNSV
ncbi:hypothetical protein BC829DRAFT_292485 [Chytridium lagenaria]|nr:hypothetical protein BC829DRAFT_292485 [Chytridium lagenaria]